MESKTKLGKTFDDFGFDEILSTEAPQLNVMTTLDINLLTPGKYQPRHNFSEQALQELASSIKQQGVLQPLIVRKIAENKYEIIAGERKVPSITHC